MICPRCDGQGNIYKANVVNLGLIIFICDECEACWEDEKSISTKNFTDLSTYLESKGTTYRVSEIVDLGYDFDE
jgi:hypothetical protein